MKLLSNLNKNQKDKELFWQTFEYVSSILSENIEGLASNLYFIEDEQYFIEMQNNMCELIIPLLSEQSNELNIEFQDFAEQNYSSWYNNFKDNNFILEGIK